MIGNKYNLINRIQDKTSDDNLQNFLFQKTAEYSIIDNYHATLQLHNYTHVTSPMRRTVDMINHYKIRKYNKEFDILNINKIVKHQRKISNIYDLIGLLEKCNQFKCVIHNEYLILESLFDNTIKKIVYDYPSIIDIKQIENSECIVELFYIPKNARFNVKFL